MRDRVVCTNFLRNRPPWFASTCVNLSHLVTVGCTALRSQGDHIWSGSPVPSQTYQHSILSHRSCPKLQQWYSTLHLPLPTYLFCITSELSKPETWLCLARSPDVLPWKPAIRGTAELEQQLTIHHSISTLTSCNMLSSFACATKRGHCDIPVSKAAPSLKIEFQIFCSSGNLTDLKGSSYIHGFLHLQFTF